MSAEKRILVGKRRPGWLCGGWGMFFFEMELRVLVGNDVGDAGRYRPAI